MTTRKFRTKQASLYGKSWRDFSFGQQIHRKESEQSVLDPFIVRECGDVLEYGNLAAYCFRRFGYPEYGWDGHKQLTRYLLTTPHPDLVLQVEPYVGNRSDIALTFLMTNEAVDRIDAFARQEPVAWVERAYEWAEAQGLPDWMPTWLETYNTDYRNDLDAIPEAKSWREAIYYAFTIGKEGHSLFEASKRAADFRQSMFAAYGQIEAQPPFYKRENPAPAQWDDTDPLKPFALAAQAVLADLHTAVSVRDLAINAYGTVSPARNPLKPSKSAGYPSGALGNTAAPEFAKLHTLILQLGKGDAKRGIKKVTELVNIHQAKF